MRSISMPKKGFKLKGRIVEIFRPERIDGNNAMVGIEITPIISAKEWERSQQFVIIKGECPYKKEDLVEFELNPNLIIEFNTAQDHRIVKE